MLNKIIRHKYQILELIIIFIITLFYNLICANISGDEIWNYGFSYNISTGLIPYKDFNMVITPLFPLIGALFLSIFGKSFVTYHIFNAIICTSIFYYMKKLFNKNYYIIYILFLINSYPNYNIFCLLLLYILMLLEDKKSNDYLIGIILGLTFLTKQNIGIYLCFPTLFTKNIKRIYKRGIGFIIPNLIMIVYLLITNSIHEFIDYTFLGMNQFAKENFTISIPVIILFSISTIYLIYNYIKNKDIKIIYLLVFQLLVYPMTDYYHIMIAIIPTIGYFLNTIKIPKLISYITFSTFIIVIFSLNIYQLSTKTNLFPNDTNTYTYKKLSPKINDYIINTSQLINKINDNLELYIISRDAYLIKLENNIKINKYDLLNEGNLGKEGEQGIINEIKDNCTNKKCIFILDLESSDNINSITYAKNIKKYIKNNYNGGNIVGSFVIYRNY